MGYTLAQIEKRYAKRQNELKQALLSAKKEGLRAFLAKTESASGKPYGLLSDGTDILYIEHVGPSTNKNPLFSICYEYEPNKSTGSACAVTEPGSGYETLNRQVFAACVQKGHALAAAYGAKRYQNLDACLEKDHWRKEHYEEL